MARGQEDAVSRLNGLRLEQPGEDEAYSVWLVGHSYGKSVFPAASLLVNVPELNASDTRALFLLGDTVRSLTPIALRNLERATSQLRMPVFVAPGNHETLELETYVRAFGSPYYELRIGRDAWIVLHLELAHDTISPAQIAWLTDRSKALARDPEIRNVMILSHHLVWCIDDPRLEIVRSRILWPPDYREGFFTRDLLPILDALASHKPVYWISGDRVSFPPFFWKDPERDVTYLATGIKDHPADSIVELVSGADGAVGFRLVSLAGLDLGPIEQYGPDFWSAYYGGQTRILNLKEPLDLQWAGIADEWMFVINKRFVYGAVSAATATCLLFVAALGYQRWRRARPTAS